jgi:hypothetical protein
VKFTDEAGRWKKYTMDAFGNIVQVEEPKPAADTVHAGNYFTYYSYDVLNHLIQVRMLRRDVHADAEFLLREPAGCGPAERDQSGKRDGTATTPTTG